MNERDRLDDRWLRALDDVQLEGLRYDLLRSGDDRFAQAVEHLLVRGVAAIERIARELCELRGLDAGQHAQATVDASVRLQVRLAREDKLQSIMALAGQLARQCVDALDPAPAERPRLASRPPRLRTVEDELGDALTDGRLKRRGGTDS